MSLATQRRRRIDGYGPAHILCPILSRNLAPIAMSVAGPSTTCLRGAQSRRAFSNLSGGRAERADSRHRESMAEKLFFLLWPISAGNLAFLLLRRWRAL